MFNFFIKRKIKRKIKIGDLVLVNGEIKTVSRVNEDIALVSNFLHSDRDSISRYCKVVDLRDLYLI